MMNGIKAFILSALLAPALFAGPSEFNLFTDRDVVQERRVLRVMSFNVENLFENLGSIHQSDLKKMPKPKPNEPAPPKTVEEVQAIRDEIGEEMPDIAVLEEVENIAALDKLIDGPPIQGKYMALLIEGNDPRGIDVGFLVRKDLGIKVQIESHKDMRWMDPVDRKEKQIFSRDLPALILGETENPKMIVLGNHAKSKRDRAGDPQSIGLRTAQYEAAAKIVRDYKSSFPKVGIILAGDFNTDVQEGVEINPIRELLFSAFDVAKDTVPLSDRGTHVYFPPKGPREIHQMDDVRVDESLKESVLSARVGRYQTADGQVLPLPRSFKERDLQPSDHFPVVVDIQIAN